MHHSPHLGSEMLGGKFMTKNLVSMAGLLHTEIDRVTSQTSPFAAASARDDDAPRAIVLG